MSAAIDRADQFYYGDDSVLFLLQTMPECAGRVEQLAGFIRTFSSADDFMIWLGRATGTPGHWNLPALNRLTGTWYERQRPEGADILQPGMRPFESCSRLTPPSRIDVGPVGREWFRGRSGAAFGALRRLIRPGVRIEAPGDIRHLFPGIHRRHDEAVYEGRLRARWALELALQTFGHSWDEAARLVSTSLGRTATRREVEEFRDLIVAMMGAIDRVQFATADEWTLESGELPLFGSAAGEVAADIRAGTTLGHTFFDVRPWVTMIVLYPVAGERWGVPLWFTILHELVHVVRGVGHGGRFDPSTVAKIIGELANLSLPPGDPAIYLLVELPPEVEL